MEIFHMPKELDDLSNRVFNGLSNRYCHIDSQRERIPTHVWTGRLGSEGGAGGTGSSQMKMWSSPRQLEDVTDGRAIWLAIWF